MSAERWQRVREVFEAVCDLPPGDRDSALASACLGDRALRVEVESLLDSSERTPAFLETGAAGVFPELFEREHASAMVGERIGAYRLERLLATGGMGAVYLASRADDEYDKLVAIKLIKRRMISDGTLRRFRLERQALATLDHPNIARLHDGGITPEGVPYLVMEYVEGMPIDRYCDERRLSTAQRLELFRAVCAAVAYAHQNLVVHRDLKPGNILVTPGGVPKLLDFGIAKVLDGRGDGADPTAAQRVMTPEYASPEQVRGEAVTTASDVYSLGVVLYELLTGHRPYSPSSRTPHEIERSICEDDPQRPSTAVERCEQTHSPDGTMTGTIDCRTVSRMRGGPPSALRRGLRGDLDEIVLKALRKEPDRRYATVTEFADDVARHLSGLPVAARRGTVRYRLGKFVRRHRAGVVAALAVALAIVGSAVATGWQASRTSARARQVERVNAFLRAMLASVDRSTASGSQDAVRAILDEATASVESGGLAGQPRVEADVRTALGTTYLELGLLDDAAPHLERALAIRRAALGGRHPDVAESLDAMGRLAKSRGDLEGGEQLYREALRIRGRHHGADSAEYAETLNNLGVLLKNRGRLDEAAAALTEALATRQAVLRAVEADRGATPADARQARIDVATTMTNLAAVLKNQGSFDPAVARYREALALLAVELGPDHYRVAVVKNNLALVLRELGQLDEAEALLREALDVRRLVFGDEHAAVATGLKNLALVLVDRGAYEQAEALYRQALAIDRSVTPDPGRLANTLASLADLLVTRGRLDEAEVMAGEALDIRRARGAETPRLAGILVTVGRLQLERGDPAAAVPVLEEALRIYRVAGHARIARAEALLEIAVDAAKEE